MAHGEVAFVNSQQRTIKTVRYFIRPGWCHWDVFLKLWSRGKRLIKCEAMLTKQPFPSCWSNAEFPLGIWDLKKNHHCICDEKHIATKWYGWKLQRKACAFQPWMLALEEGRMAEGYHLRRAARNRTEPIGGSTIPSSKALSRWQSQALCGQSPESPTSSGEPLQSL